MQKAERIAESSEALLMELWGYEKAMRSRGASGTEIANAMRIIDPATTLKAILADADELGDLLQTAQGNPSRI